MNRDIASIADGVYESARLDDNLDHSGGLTVSWNSGGHSVIHYGSTLNFDGITYVMLSDYAPRRVSKGHWRYEAHYSHPQALLDRIPFWVASRNAEGEDVRLRTTSYTGPAGTIISNMLDFLNATNDIVGSGWTSNASALATATVTISFDACSVYQAFVKVADALKCNVFFDWHQKVVKFIMGTTIKGERYDGLHVLGGTRNMGKKAISGGYAAVTERLKLPDGYPDSTIMLDDGSGLGLIEDVVFDDIYPKLELYISSVRGRQCYLTDEKGQRIVDHWEAAGQTVPEGADGSTVVYKKYTKWYVRLSTDSAGTNEYQYDRSLLVNDKPLSLLFQMGTGTGTTSPLAGRQFELVRFEEDTTEWSDDDVLPRETPFRAQAGEYRIVTMADGETLLPAMEVLIPQVGNKVTLVNVKCGQAEYDLARQELLRAANELKSLKDSSATTEYSFETLGAPVVGDEMTEDGITGIVVSVSTDIDTGLSQVSLGSWERKTALGSLGDRVESVQLSGGGTQSEPSTGEKGMSQTSYETIAMTVKKPDYVEQINSFGAELEEVRRQADSQFLIWFGNGTPTGSNYPAMDWQTTQEKDEHVQDIYYDTSKQPASTGGRAWRWMFYQAGTVVDGETLAADTWRWEEITDADTLASLERLSNVESDGVLSGGAEKSRLSTEWAYALEQYMTYSRIATAHDVPHTALNAAFYRLWKMLDGQGNQSTLPEEAQDDMTVSSTPLWLADLSSNTVLNVTPADYRNAWNLFYGELNETMGLLDGRAQEASQAVVEMSDDGYLTHSEKLQVKKEFVGLYHEMTDGNGLLSQSTSIAGESVVTAYTAAFSAIGSYLNGGTQWAIPSELSETTESGVGTMPLWLNEDIRESSSGVITPFISRTNRIDGAVWRGLWGDFFAARSAVLTRLSEQAKASADLALGEARSRIHSFVSATLPPPPYSVGDLWFRQVSAGSQEYDLLSCVRGREAGDSQASASDWQQLSNPFVSVTSQMADLVELWEDAIGEEGHLSADSHPALTLFLSPIKPSTPQVFDLWWGQDNGRRVLYQYNGSWAAAGSVWAGGDDFLGQIEGMGISKLRFVATMEIATPQLYDAFSKRSSFHDNFTNSNIEGGLGIWVYGRHGWELVRENTSGVMENFGNHIVQAIFGTSPDGQTNYASGITTQSNFSRMFAEAADPDTGDLKARAGISVHVDEHNNGYVDITGTLRSVDGYLRVQEYKEFYNSAHYSVALMIGSPSGFQPVSGETEYEAVDRERAAIDDQEVIVRRTTTTATGLDDMEHTIRNGKIELRSFHDDEIEGETVINGGSVTSGSYNIRELHNGSRYNIPGEGSVASPVRFTTADGKTVTVMGGIITGIV